MMKKAKWIVCFVYCFIQLMMSAQDTIYKRNGELISAKVLEINIKEISYKRMDFLDGPLIIVSKNDILKIKYITGAIDSFALVLSQVAYKPVPSNFSHPDIIKLSIRKGVYVYQERNISDRKLMMYASEKNLIWNNKEITVEMVSSKRNKSLQYMIGFGGAAIGITGLLGSLAATGYTSNSTDVLSILIGASASAGIIISSQIVSFSYKLKRIKNADKVVNLYNQLSEK